MRNHHAAAGAAVVSVLGSVKVDRSLGSAQVSLFYKNVCVSTLGGARHVITVSVGSQGDMIDMLFVSSISLYTERHERQLNLVEKRCFKAVHHVLLICLGR